MIDADAPAPDPFELGPLTRRVIAESTPVFFPAIPFAFVVGVAINESAMPRWVGWLSSPVIWAGAAQFATVSLAGTVTLITLIVTGVVINSRHIMYSAAMAPRFRGQPRWFRWFGPYLMIDQIFAMTATKPELKGREFRRYYIAVGIFFWIGWHIFLSLGMVLGSTVPESWRLGTAPAVMFIGFVVLGITRRPAAIAAVVAAVVCLLTLGLPNRLGLLVGAAAGVAAGYLADRDRDGEIRAVGRAGQES